MIKTEDKTPNDSKPVTITFIVHMASNTRAQKRVFTMRSLGARSIILAFERHTFAGKPWPEGYTSLGWIQHGSYHKRLPTFLNAFFKVRNALKQSDAIYVFGQDLLLLGFMARIALRKQPVVICEIADIEGILIGKGVLSRFLRWLERMLLSRVDLLVVTSESYVTEYYHKVQGLRHLKTMVVENKVDARTHRGKNISPRREKWDGILHIGYFGIYWYPRSWDVLCRVVDSGDGAIRAYLRGIAMNLGNFEERVARSPHIDYGGSFVSPDDLSEIYGKVDVTWLAFDVHNKTKQWVRSNRFYQSCFFRKPMIAQTGTLDGDFVESNDLGLCVDLMDAQKTITQIQAISETDLLRWKNNIDRLPESIYCHVGEHREIIDFIKKAN